MRGHFAMGPTAAIQKTKPCAATVPDAPSSPEWLISTHRQCRQNSDATCAVEPPELRDGCVDFDGSQRKPVADSPFEPQGHRYCLWFRRRKGLASQPTRSLHPQSIHQGADVALVASHCGGISPYKGLGSRCHVWGDNGVVAFCVEPLESGFSAASCCIHAKSTVPLGVGREKINSSILRAFSSPLLAAIWYRRTASA